jgi:hypothetical protein
MDAAIAHRHQNRHQTVAERYNQLFLLFFWRRERDSNPEHPGACLVAALHFVPLSTVKYRRLARDLSRTLPRSLGDPADFRRYWMGRAPGQSDGLTIHALPVALRQCGRGFPKFGLGYSRSVSDQCYLATANYNCFLCFTVRHHNDHRCTCSVERVEPKRAGTTGKRRRDDGLKYKQRPRSAVGPVPSSSERILHRVPAVALGKSTRLYGCWLYKTPQKGMSHTVGACRTPTVIRNASASISTKWRPCDVAHRQSRPSGASIACQRLHEF